jgi:hypothetical protein
LVTFQESLGLLYLVLRVQEETRIAGEEHGRKAFTKVGTPKALTVGMIGGHLGCRGLLDGKGSH